MNKENEFNGGCLICNYETSDRNELAAHNCAETMKDTWGKFQQELQAPPLCGACGQYYEENQQGEDGYHSAALCDANDEIGE
jgi:hypothetical protein